MDERLKGKTKPNRDLAETPDALSGVFDAYVDYARTLRTWLVAYGVGGPVLFVSNDTVWKAITGSGRAGLIAGLFLAGVAAHVIVTTVNKAAMWSLYYGQCHPEFKARKRYRCMEWWSEQLWIDLGVDAASILLFSAATWIAVRTLATAVVK